MSTKTTIGLAVVLALGAATAAVAMTNYEVNASLAAFAPQNDPAAVSAQNPVQVATPMKRPFFEDKGRFIIDSNLPPFAKPQSRC